MNQTEAKRFAPLTRNLYLLSTFFLGLTGFAQMPIFKRYYIADIPGLGWLSQFYVTHTMHYLGAIVLLALAAYVLFDYFGETSRGRSLTPSGYVRSIMLAALIVSGIFLAIRNQPGTHFGPDFIIFLDLLHLGLVIALIATGLYCLVRKRRWLR